MPRVLGIIGGGQLGMMLAEAAERMPGEISRIIVLDPTEGCPASQAGAEQIVADFKDKDAIMALSEQADIITYEIESGDSDVLRSAQKNADINPSPETLRVIQDKFLQKTFLKENGIPVPAFVSIENMDDLRAGLEKFGYPALLKARRDAYDGRGNYKIGSEAEVQAAYEYFGGQKLMLEEFVPFRMEVSVIAARNTRGQIRTYPLVENLHEDNILRETIAPARVSPEITQKAEAIAEKTMSVLRGAGIFGIEMFVTREGQVLINEIAPRVHNSGHHSLQSSETSQFEQHLRAILGMELGGTRLVHNTIMYNILGAREFEGRYKGPELDENNLHLKMYGKQISKPLRKLGHLNLVGADGQTVDQLLERLEEIKPRAAVRPVS